MSDEDIHTAAVRAARHIADLTKGRLPPTTTKRWWCIANWPTSYFHSFVDGSSYVEKTTGLMLFLSEDGEFGRGYSDYEVPGDFTSNRKLPLSLLEPLTEGVYATDIRDATACFASGVNSKFTLTDEDSYGSRIVSGRSELDVQAQVSSVQSGRALKQLLDALERFARTTTTDVDNAAKDIRAKKLLEEEQKRDKEQRAKVATTLRFKKKYHWIANLMGLVGAATGIGAIYFALLKSSFPLALLLFLPCYVAFRINVYFNNEDSSGSQKALGGDIFGDITVFVIGIAILLGLVNIQAILDWLF